MDSVESETERGRTHTRERDRERTHTHTRARARTHTPWRQSSILRDVDTHTHTHTDTHPGVTLARVDVPVDAQPAVDACGLAHDSVVHVPHAEAHVRGLVVPVKQPWFGENSPGNGDLKW